MENIFTLQKRAALAKVVRDASTIGIIASTRQNLDTIGAALALYLSLKEAQKNTQVVSSRDPLVEISSLFGIDNLKRSFDSALKQLTISFPFVEGEIEKAMYKTEGDKINVHFYAAQDKTITFKDSDVKFIKKGGTPDVIFALAVSDDEIKEFVESPQNVTLIRISRHPKDTSGTIVYQDPAFSSVCEIVARVIQEQGLPVDADAAQNLLDGIVFSTYNFTNPKTSAQAFEAAGYLLKKGAKRKEAELEKEAPKMASADSAPEAAKPEVKEDASTFVFKRDTETASPMQNEVPEVKEAHEVKEAPKEAVTQEVPQVEPVQAEAPAPEVKEEKAPEAVPSDWFEPKVFKTNQTEQ